MHEVHNNRQSQHIWAANLLPLGRACDCLGCAAAKSALSGRLFFCGFPDSAAITNYDYPQSLQGVSQTNVGIQSMSFWPFFMVDTFVAMRVWRQQTPLIETLAGWSSAAFAKLKLEGVT